MVDKTTGASEKTARLKHKHLIFVEEYLKGCSATEAALRAGYSPKNAPKASCNFLKNPNIIRYLEQRQEEIKNSKMMQMDELVARLTDIARGEDLSESTEITGTGACNIKKKERLKAMELLARIHGATTPKVAVQANVNINFAGENDLQD